LNGYLHYQGLLIGVIGVGDEIFQKWENSLGYLCHVPGYGEGHTV